MADPVSALDRRLTDSILSRADFKRAEMVRVVSPDGMVRAIDAAALPRPGGGQVVRLRGPGGAVHDIEVGR